MRHPDVDSFPLSMTTAHIGVVGARHPLADAKTVEDPLGALGLALNAVHHAGGRGSAVAFRPSRSRSRPAMNWSRSSWSRKSVVARVRKG